MNIYVDDDMAKAALVARLRRAGHDVGIPSQTGLTGARDARHFLHAIENRLALLTRNRGDFGELHDIVVACGGRHSGILIITLDNDPTKDITDRGIETALRKLEQSGLDLTNQVLFLSYWR